MPASGVAPKCACTLFAVQTCPAVFLRWFRLQCLTSARFACLPPRCRTVRAAGCGRRQCALDTWPPGGAGGPPRRAGLPNVRKSPQDCARALGHARPGPRHLSARRRPGIYRQGFQHLRPRQGQGRPSRLLGKPGWCRVCRSSLGLRACFSPRSAAGCPVTEGRWLSCHRVLAVVCGVRRGVGRHSWRGRGRYCRSDGVTSVTLLHPFAVFFTTNAPLRARGAFISSKYCIVFPITLACDVLLRCAICGNHEPPRQVQLERHLR